MRNDDIPVSDTDRISEEGGPRADRTRLLGEFSRTNSPLSAVEIEDRKAFHRLKAARELHWIPRTAENIHDIALEPILPH